MHTNTTFQKINKKPKQEGTLERATIKAKTNKPKHINKRVWGE